MRQNERGFTLIDVLFVVAVIGVLAAMAIPALARARGGAQAAAMMGDLRMVNSAQLSYAITCGSGFYAKDLPTLSLKPPASPVGFINEELGTGITVNRRGYSLTLDATPLPGSPAGCSGAPPGDGAPAYRAGADSLVPAHNVFFATNAQGVIYYHTASLFAVTPENTAPPIGQPIH